MKYQKTYVYVRTFLSIRFFNESAENLDKLSQSLIEKIIKKSTNGMVILPGIERMDQLILEWLETQSSKKMSQIVKTFLGLDI